MTASKVNHPLTSPFETISPKMLSDFLADFSEPGQGSKCLNWKGLT